MRTKSVEKIIERSQETPQDDSKIMNPTGTEQLSRFFGDLTPTGEKTEFGEDVMREAPLRVGDTIVDQSGQPYTLKESDFVKINDGKEGQHLVTDREGGAALDRVIAESQKQAEAQQPQTPPPSDLPPHLQDASPEEQNRELQEERNFMRSILLGKYKTADGAEEDYDPDKPLTQSQVDHRIALSNLQREADRVKTMYGHVKGNQILAYAEQLRKEETAAHPEYQEAFGSPEYSIKFIEIAQHEISEQLKEEQEELRRQTRLELLREGSQGAIGTMSAMGAVGGNMHRGGGGARAELQAQTERQQRGKRKSRIFNEGEVTDRDGRPVDLEAEDEIFKATIMAQKDSRQSGPGDLNKKYMTEKGPVDGSLLTALLQGKMVGEKE